MPGSRTYVTRRRASRSQETRDRIMEAVRQLLAEGTFHESTVEQIAKRAGMSRATLYQHFHSRLDLVDAMCETFDRNPALQALRAAVEAAEPEVALDETIASLVRFWSSEESIHRQLYGVAAVDPAARDLVERQFRDRRGELRRLIDHLDRAGRLRHGPTERRALALLLVLTSFETFQELRREGLSKKEALASLQEMARELVLDTTSRT